MVLVHVCTILRRTWTYYTIIQILCLSYDTPKSRVILPKKNIQTWHFATDCFLHSHHISANLSSLILPFGITYIYIQVQVSVVLSVYINAGMVGIECFYFAFRGRQILNHKCFIVIDTTCMTMDIIDKCFYMSHERQMKLIFQIDIDYPQGYYQVIMAQLEMWPVAL